MLGYSYPMRAKSGRPSRIDHERVIALLESGLSLRAVARALKTSAGSVWVASHPGYTYPGRKNPAGGRVASPGKTCGECGGQLAGDDRSVS